MQLFRSRVSKLWSGKFQDDDQVFLADLRVAVNDGLSMDELFGTGEATAILEAMTEANELMLSDSIVYKV
jgi:DNA replication licensing factor MCM3